MISMCTTQMHAIILLLLKVILPSVNFRYAGSDTAQQAELALFKRLPEEAERILLQSSPPLVYRAIKLNLNLFRWERALDLALKYNIHLETVLGYRQKYLDEFQREEKNQKFLKHFKTVNFDWNSILQAEEAEIEKESNAGRGGGNRSRK